MKTNYKKSSDLSLFLKVEYFLIELCIAVPHSPCEACIYAPLFSVSLPPLQHTHTLNLHCCSVQASTQTGYITINLSEFLLNSLGHVQTQQGNHISPACLWGERENYPLFIINITKTKGMLGRGLKYEDKYSPLVWSLLLCIQTASAQDNHMSESIGDNEWKNTCWSLYFNKVNADNFLCCSVCWDCESLWGVLVIAQQGKEISSVF